MKNIIFRICIYYLLLIFSPLFVFANDQSVVIGLDAGAGSFSTIDGIRKKGVVCSICDDAKSVTMVNLYAEWYFFDSIGIGFRGASANGGWDLQASSNVKVTHKWTSTNSLLTGNWIFWGETEYTRAGAIIGAGSSKYEYKATLEMGSSKVEDPYETSGTATMFGIFLDWGGESFGARLGYDSVMTTLDPLVVGSTSYQADGSYSGAYLGLRWAW